LPKENNGKEQRYQFKLVEELHNSRRLKKNLMGIKQWINFHQLEHLVKSDLTKIPSF
jgi:hypothetical protein